jgi:hypothetical protein
MMTDRTFARRPPDPARGNILAGVVIGGFGALLLSVALLPLRDHLPNANMALALVVPVLAGAIIGGYWAAAVSSLVAAICFDFIFTKPYNSLRIASKDDVATFFVFLIVAMSAAVLGVRARRGSADAREARAELQRLYRVSEISAHGADVDDVISAVRAEMIGLFELVDCVFEAAPSGPPLPRLGHTGALESARLVAVGEFLLPTGGVELPVTGRGQELGRLVLYAGELTRAPLGKRLVAVAIADELGTTLATV